MNKINKYDLKIGDVVVIANFEKNTDEWSPHYKGKVSVITRVDYPFYYLENDDTTPFAKEQLCVISTKENMKYKIGDRVRIKNIDWYNTNKDEDGIVELSTHVFTPGMPQFCGRVMTISHVGIDYYTMVEDLVGYWTDEMIEGLVEEETKPKFKIGDIIVKAHLRFRIVEIKSDRYIVEERPGINLVVLFKDQDKYRLVEKKTKPDPKFYIGDRVKWYNHTCNITDIYTDEDMYTYLIKHDDYREGKSFTKWVPESELTFEDDEEMKSKDELVDEYEELTDRAFKGGYEKCKFDIELNGFQLPDGYIFKDENGNVINATKIVLEKKKKEYPKTYEECCKVLGIDTQFCMKYLPHGTLSYKDTLIYNLQALLVCRDAYWKIAGEEMGLGKPWEPDWNTNELKYIIYYENDKLWFNDEISRNTILAFPTEEMRDAFYENFKSEIEFCKELL